MVLLNCLKIADFPFTYCLLMLSVVLLLQVQFCDWNIDLLL